MTLLCSPSLQFCGRRAGGQPLARLCTIRVHMRPSEFSNPRVLFSMSAAAASLPLYARLAVTKAPHLLTDPEKTLHVCTGFV